MVVIINKKDLWDSITDTKEIQNELFNNQFMELNGILRYYYLEMSLARQENLEKLRQFICKI